MTQTQPSAWQQKITGDWHGTPSVFDANGEHLGHIKVTRASTHANGRTTYTMDTALDLGGPMRARLEATRFAFGVMDGDQDRVYLGPDFVGTGNPMGTLVDARYYSPGWQADLRTMVQVMAAPDGSPLQVYSSLLFEGPTMLAVFNGLYCQQPAGGNGAAYVEAFLARERAAGRRSHVLPQKEAGRWTGVLETVDAGGAVVGATSVRIDHTPRTLLASDSTITIEGAINARWRGLRSRRGNRHAWEGPELWGNAIAYGRAIYTTWHVFGEPVRVEGREFLLDGDDLAVVWHVTRSGKRTHTLQGRLAWESTGTVLDANYDPRSAA